MTRGTGYLITNLYYYTHDEFNGDMYCDGGHGLDFLQMMYKTNGKNFKSKLKKWNKENHNYDDFSTYKELLHEGAPFIRKEKNQIVIDFAYDYYKFWFSNYIFIKNGTNKKIKVITCSDTNRIAGETIFMKPNETTVFNFGRFDDGACFTLLTGNMDAIHEKIERDEND